MKRAVYIVLLGLIGALSGCLPMTLSHDGRIDFTRYRSVYVQPIEITGNAVFSDIDSATQSYLVDELAAISGFYVVTGDELADTDCVLVVRLRVDEEFVVRDGEDERTYRTFAEFSLRTPDGQEIAASDVSEDNSSIVEAQEDALDEVAHFFLAPYRI